MKAAARQRDSARGRVPFAQAVRRRALENGARIFVLENRFNPTVAVSGSLRAGPLFLPPGRRLIASVTAGELAKGTERRTKLQIAEDLESRGASLSFSSDSSDPVGVDIAGAALSRDVDLLLDRMVEILREPVFPAEELEKEKKRLVGSIRQQLDQPGVRAYEAAARRVYPPGHPFHRRTGEERIASVEALTLEDLSAFYREHYGAATLQLVVVGDVAADAILEGLAKLLDSWPAGSPSPIPPVPVPQAAPGRETVVMPDKASADVVLLEPSTLTRSDSEYLACTLANSALGQSSLTSRLGVRVRDTEGLTYGIHSSFHATHVPGPFVVGVTVKPESRDAAEQGGTATGPGRRHLGRALGEELPDRKVPGGPRLQRRNRASPGCGGVLRPRAGLPRPLPLPGRVRHEGGGGRGVPQASASRPVHHCLRGVLLDEEDS